MSDLHPKKANEPKVIQSVARAIDVLEVIAQSGTSCSIAYIAEQTGLPSPTVFRQLSTLASRGWVIKTSRREYSIGAAFFSLTAAAGSSIGSAMDETLDTLVSRTGESASVATLERSSAVYIAHKSSSRPIRLFTEVGNRVPLYATGVGKSLLAAMSDEDLEAYLTRFEGRALTDRTITEKTALRDEIELVREVGLAFDNEEQEMGIRCVATWVPESKNFAVSVSGPPSRMVDDFVEAVVRPALLEAVGSLGVILSKPGRRPQPRENPIPPVYMGLGI